MQLKGLLFDLCFNVACFLCISSTVNGKECNLVDSCTCEMSDGSGKINLHSLAIEETPGQTLREAAFGTYGNDGYTYNYNPCVGFNFYPLTDLAVVQITKKGDLAYDLGVQSKAGFEYSEASGLSITYTSAVDKRKSKIQLVCQQNLNANLFEFVGELETLVYDFILSTPCACPGICDDNGPIVPLPTPPPSTTNNATCIRVDSCTCVMSDGSGQINLHSHALSATLLSDWAYSVDGDDEFYYMYNPCWGFRTAGYTDLAVFQSVDSSGSDGNDLGVQIYADFRYNASNGLSILYESSDSLRKSQIFLSCTPGVTESKFEFIGQLINQQYEFILTTPCACPGTCNSEGIIGVQPSPTPGTKSCTKVDSCTCDMSDGSGQINLHGHALEAVGGQPLTDAAFSIVGLDGWTYKYNPCNGFEVLTLSDLALVQMNDNSNAYDLGVQASANFIYSDSSGLSIKYQSGTPFRTGRVLLVCEPNVDNPIFEFVGELTSLEYDFILSTPCACPGACDDDGPIGPLPTATPPPTGITCDLVDSCTCEMSDGSGQVNLHGAAIVSVDILRDAYTVAGDGWIYKYSPCTGFYAAGFSNLAVFQSQDVNALWGFDLGVQSFVEFSYSESSGLTIQYTAFDKLRTSRILLICEPGTTDHKLEFIGELSSGEYDFLFTSPCACPGACDNNGIIAGPTTPNPFPSTDTCTKVDACTCDMSDGSGRVNLKSLSLKGNDLKDSAFNALSSDGWNYKYNPCEGFTFQIYSDLAVAQVSRSGGNGYDLGVQSTASFLYQKIDDSQYSLSLRYTAADGLRASKVNLICEAGLNQNKFQYVGEMVTLEYDFILISPCACPGLCDDDGPTISLPTPSPTPSPGTTCTYIDPCTCQMSDGSGRINLHGPALDDSYLYDSAFTVYGYDDWYYKYNPCNGFYMGHYSDLAIYQSPDYNNDYLNRGSDLGVQSTVTFEYDDTDGLYMHYKSFDILKSSTVFLVCAPDTEDKFEYIGEIVTNEFYFSFTSPCACPGACDYNGVIGGPASPPPGSDVCSYVDSCTCDMSDGSGRVNLHSLSLTGDSLTDSAYTIIGDDTRVYKYNPCKAFQYYGFYDLAVVQQDSFSASAYDLGTQATAQFGYTETNGLTIHYKAYDGVRSSRVSLLCEPNLNVNKLQYVGELVVLEYDFILATPCACPGYCDDDGPVITLPTQPPSVGEGGMCTFIDSCTCEMSDMSGNINLHSTALEGTSLYDAAYTIYGDDGWYYKFNPCNGFFSDGHYDLAMFQTDSAGTSGSGNDLGVQTSTYFNYTETNGVSIHYKAADSLRTSRVLLICTPGTTEHKLEFIGELLDGEFEFTFATPCACPGGCDDDGIIESTPPPGTDVCQFVDSCTCDMNDGTGRVNLHSLAEEPVLGYLSNSAFTITGSDGWTYKYNPCNGFSFYVYNNVAVAQTDYTEVSGFDLGVQSKLYFTYQETNGLSILYTSGDGLRKSRVRLVCQSEVNSNVFEFVGELTVAEYDFILSSPCACPGVCDDDGPINVLPTEPPGEPGDKTCDYVDTCTCEMSDGSGEINLNSLSLGDYYYYYGDSAFTELGDDGYYYKYNPCYGFYFQNNYDTAVAQSEDIYGYGYGYVLGVQSTATFLYDEASGVTISYVSYDRQRSSRVLLVCEPHSNIHKFQVIGQAVSSEYEFMLTSPCACPGGCDADGVIEAPSKTNCTKLDSCSCEMSDGTGRVNLRSIGLQGDSLTEAAFTYDGLDGWFYKYNPCVGFSYLYYDDLALAQVNSFGTAGHDLGVQRGADFRYSNVNGLSIHYVSSDDLRSSKVLLICDPYAMEAQFEFIGELVTLEYDFLLKTVCACPGGCTDFGPVHPIITQPPLDGGVGNMPDTVNVYVNHTGDRDPSYYFWPDVGGSSIALIFHDIFFILLIAAIVFLVKNVVFCRNQASQAKQTFAHIKDTVTDDVTV